MKVKVRIPTTVYPGIEIPESGYPFYDDFGPFKLKVATCCHCGAENQLSVKYSTSASITVAQEKIDLGRTVLKKLTNSIGVTCGCYAKLHRQVTHIRHNSDERNRRHLEKEG